MRLKISDGLYLRQVKDKYFIGLFVIGIIISLPLILNLICGYDPEVQNLSETLQPPSRQHLLGTDVYGRDMLARVLAGGQITIYGTLMLVTITTTVGSLLGMIGGYYEGKIDGFIEALIHIFLAFPGIVLAIAVAGVLGGGMKSAIIALTLISWPKYARLTRSQVRHIKTMPYIAAARLGGCSTVKIIIRHMLPNMLPTIMMTAILDIGTMIMEIAGLSYLGLGAAPPAAEWGLMMSQGRSMFQMAPWVVLAPGGAIFITVMLFNLLGDWLRDRLDPRLKG